MTYRALMLRLRAAGIESPSTDARILLSHFCGVDAAEIFANPERDYTGDALDDAVRAREKRVPLQHILGETHFYGNRFAVSSACLSPRADTEILVDEACRLLPKGARFADFCTGSGCIAISVLVSRPDTTALAVDISEDALAVAQKNAALAGVADRVTFLRTDLLKDALSAPDYILSNPPYIRRDVIPTLAPELSHEPMIALDGGEDGLVFYRTLLSRFSPKLFLFEIGYDQADAVSALGRAAGYTMEVKQDLGGHDRVVILRR